MDPWNEKVRITVGRVTLDLPASVVPDPRHAVDTSVKVFETTGLTVIVDDGPFADRLDRAGGAEFEERTADLAGCSGRLISFLAPGENTRTTGFHVSTPRVFTIIVRADVSVPRDVVEDVFRSLRLRDN